MVITKHSTGHLPKEKTLAPVDYLESKGIEQIGVALGVLPMIAEPPMSPVQDHTYCCSCPCLRLPHPALAGSHQP